jgi:hypothetical protein
MKPIERLRVVYKLLDAKKNVKNGKIETTKHYVIAEIN